MNQEKAIQVLIVDDYTIVRAGLRAMLEEHPDIRIVGEASNGVEAIFFVEKFRPHVVVMDINMRNVNGIEATARIIKGYPDTRIIGLSENAATENEEAIKRVGAVRVLSKESTIEELYNAIRKTMTNCEPPKHPER